MKRFKISLENAPEDVIKEFVNVITRGGIAIYPTDTVYGLGCDPFNEKAVEKIFKLKKRDLRKPIPLLVSDLEAVEKLAYVDELAYKVMKSFWPGPLTILIEVKKNAVPSIVTAKLNKIGLRQPKCEITLKLIEAVGGFLTGTSANISGKEAPSDVETAIRYFGKDIDLVLDAGKTPITIPSTVIDLTTRPLKVVREGPISKEDLKKKLGIEVI